MLSSEQIPFYSNLWPGPWSPVHHPPAPAPPCTRRPLSLWGPVSLSLCNPCPDAIYGGTAFPAFVSSLRWAPGSFSKAFPGPFSTARAGGGEAGRRGPQLGPPIVHQGPHPMSPTRARLANPGHTMGQLPNLAFLLFLSKALCRPAPPHPWWGVEILDVRVSIAGLFRGYHVACFFLINLTFPQSTSLPVCSLPGTFQRWQRREENKGQTDRLTWSAPLGWTEADQSVSSHLQDILQIASPGS